MDTETQRALLEKSGSTTLQQKLLHSISMKEFLQLIESKVEFNKDGSSDELRLVNEFLRAFEQEA